MSRWCSNQLSYAPAEGTRNFITGDGLIDDVAVRTLDTNQTLDSWNFDDVTGFIATGSHGHVLNLQAAEWIDISHDQGVSDGRD